MKLLEKLTLGLIHWDSTLFNNHMPPCFKVNTKTRKTHNSNSSDSRFSSRKSLDAQRDVIGSQILQKKRNLINDHNAHIIIV
mmetsp:Transcript_25778/g.54239  ORF Transcript_25778/g.54239 Transcript_25778/m.54239 type:complete len:82 (-) Transcript_25778:1482-1727(-)